MSRHRRPENKVVVPVVGVTAVLTGIAAAIAVPAIAGPEEPPDIPAAAGAPDLGTAMREDLGLTSAQVRARLAAEANAAEAARALRGTLGPSYAGSWFDSSAGRLVVAVTDPARSDRIRAAGARPRVVEHSMAELTGAKRRLDRMGAAVPDAVTGWYVQPGSNSVVVEVDSRQWNTATERMLTGLREQGTPLRVHQAPMAPRPLADIVGGDPFTFGADGGQGRCSIGFSATGPDGSAHFLTAGHCTTAGGTARDIDGQEIGPISESVFDTAGDFGLVDVTDPGSRLTPLVNRQDGTAIEVAGSAQAPVGASICRSGSTTGFFCGEVAAFDQTVNYGNGDIVRGLTRTTVCAEPGDSGGSFISGTQAQGMTSGGSGDCTSGGVTFFQPVNEALQAFGLDLVTTGQSDRRFGAGSDNSDDEGVYGGR
ncbi:S1 family peptidase [Amycolatopsis aidingensis]|uniref:S1 family peptidase n=1 Tax=Amycolatopsis aidingensis TaxID=2842453 RepID=UPI0022B6619D|nr:S1 family peptidase [Amycolatopsis aidingensis]